MYSISMNQESKKLIYIVSNYIFLIKENRKYTYFIIVNEVINLIKQ